MPRRLKLSRLQAAAPLASDKESAPSFICLYRRDPGAGLLGPAEQGDANAQYELGRLRFEGRAAESHTRFYGKDGKDVVASDLPARDRNYLSAEKWLQKAADQGHPEARQLLEVVKLHIKDGVH